MQMFEYIVPCLFGVESVVKKEIQELGYEITEVEDGRVTFKGDISAIARVNIFLRSGERLLLKVGRFKATSFEELYQTTKELNWEDFIPKEGKVWVSKASSIKSKLFSTSDIQSIIKKAIVDRLKNVYNVQWLAETGTEYPLRAFFLKDEVTIGLDASGESLHRRGYRQLVSRAPLTETLAAGLIQLTPWKHDRILIDPFCGSGTFAIEAALLGANIAPGMRRGFIARGWENFVPKKIWAESMDEAKSKVTHDVKMDIQAYDIDGKMVKAARENAKKAGVDHLIHFQQRDMAELRHPKKYGFIITNPPYGERLEAKDDLPGLYKEMGKVFGELDAWSYFILTGYEDAERHIGKKADKNRKIYNGMLKAYFYQYYGPKPKK